MKNWINSGKTIYFSYFSGIWTSFNVLFNDTYPLLRTDREKIDEIKRSPPSNLIRSFNQIGDSHSNSLERLEKTESDPMTKGFIQYSFENALTRLYKFAFTNQTIKPTLENLIISDKIHSIYLPSNSYQEIYKIIREFEASEAGITFPSVSIQKLLEDYGISSKGPIFYNDPAKITNPNKSFQAKQIQTFVTSKLKFDVGNIQVGLFADTLEIVYQIRCACIHGDFNNPGTVENNDLFQAAYEFLYRLLSLFLGEQPSDLHF